MDYNFLNNIAYPSDLKKLNFKDLKFVANELRHKTITTVSKTGGHLGAGLGVVELTIGLHYVLILLGTNSFGMLVINHIHIKF